MSITDKIDIAAWMNEPTPAWVQEQVNREAEELADQREHCYEVYNKGAAAKMREMLREWGVKYTEQYHARAYFFHFSAPKAWDVWAEIERREIPAN